MIRVQAWNEFVSPKFYGPLAIWPWLKISPQSSLNGIYCLIITVWQCLMSFTYTPCISMQIKPNKNPLRNRLMALLLWKTGHLSSPSRSCLGRIILIQDGWGVLLDKAPHGDNHTVHMHSQWHLLPPLTSTVKLALFMHVHSSPLPLPARIHWCEQTIFVILTMAGLFPDRLCISSHL